MGFYVQTEQTLNILTIILSQVVGLYIQMDKHNIGMNDNFNKICCLYRLECRSSGVEIIGICW